MSNIADREDLRTLSKTRRVISFANGPCDAISAVPESVRPKHFLDKDLTESDRRARLLAKLKLSDSKLSSRLAENAKRLDRMRDVLGSLEKTSGSASRSPGLPNTSADKNVKKDRR